MYTAGVIWPCDDSGKTLHNKKKRMEEERGLQPRAQRGENGRAMSLDDRIRDTMDSIYSRSILRGKWKDGKWTTVVNSGCRKR